MAEGGEEIPDTLRLGSEDFIEFPCSKCEEDGKIHASIKHCKECRVNLCKTCLTFHERFTSGHHIVDILDDQKGQQRPEVPTQRCAKHGDKLVDVFCPTHDNVGCATCVAFDHRSCKEIKYIPDVVKSSSFNKDISELETRMQQLLSRLDEIKNQKQERIILLQNEKDAILEEIKNLRERINKHLDELEKCLKCDVESRLAGNIKSTIQDLKTVEEMKSSVEKRQKTFQDSKNSNDSALFVQMKQENKHLEKQEQTLQQLSVEKQRRSIKLFPGRIEEVLFDDNNSLGRISEILVPKSIHHIGEINAQLASKDKKTCSITEFCWTSSGYIVCIDSQNNRLKKLDSSYAVIDSLAMSESPFSLCEVDKKKMAVTLPNSKKVQFVSQQPLKQRRSFTVGDRCTGIEFQAGQLYVCCGGFENESRGHIEIYNIDGNLMKIVYEGLSLPTHIKATGDGNLFLSNGIISKLHRVNKFNFRLSEIEIKKISEVSRFCRIGDGQLCITGYESNNIVLMSEDGEQQQLLTKDSGIVKPRALCFDERQSRLIIASGNSNVLKVYRVVT